jgi:hypothetical protein
MKRFPEAIRYDGVYWHNEKTNTSVLSAAVWKSGGVSKTEYSIRRGKNNKTRQGFCDMFLEIDGFSFSVEAKNLIGYVKIETNMRNVEKQLQESQRQIQDRAGEKVDGERVSLCFMVPRGSAKGPAKDSSNHFNELLRAMEKKYRKKPKILFASYKEDTPLDDTSDPEYPGYYPGIILVAKVLPK